VEDGRMSKAEEVEEFCDLTVVVSDDVGFYSKQQKNSLHPSSRYRRKRVDSEFETAISYAISRGGAGMA
jgi:hypothetical protein